MILLRAIKWSPNGLALEETHSMNQAIRIASESMIDAFRKRHQVALFHMNSNPLVVKVAHVKVATAAQNEANLFGIVD